VAVLGLGAMGSALAEALIQAGHAVAVWNRDPKKSAAFAGRARVAASAAEAVRAAPLTVICVSDHGVQTAVLEPLMAELAGRTVCSMGSSLPTEARHAAALMAARGVAYVQGAITTYPVRIGNPSTLNFYAGDRRAHAGHEHLLRAFGGVAVFTGDDPGSASVAGQAWGTVLGGFMLGMLQAAAHCEAEGVDVADVAAPVASYGVELRSLLDEAVTMTSARSYDGDQAALALWLPVFEGLIDGARRSGLDTTFARAASDIVARAIDAGWGTSQFPAVFEVLRAPSGGDAAQRPVADVDRAS
jgi:3-hydroxyisobutyrate dehydrogenase-like beta-hydroxyacid dehydrogenase